MGVPTSSRVARPSRWPAILLLVFVVAALVRVVWLIRQAMQTGDLAVLTFDDERWYWRMAESLHRGDGLVGEFGHRAARMPLYPALLSLVAGTPRGVVWAKIAQVFVGALTALLAAVLARSAAAALVSGQTDRDAPALGNITRRSSTVGLIAGLIVAADPLLVGVTSLLLTETLFVALLVALWCIGCRLVDANTRPIPETSEVRRSSTRRPGPLTRLWVGTALLTVALVYTRPSSLAPLGGWFLFLLIHDRFRLRSVLAVVAVAATVVLCFLPWAIRNQRLTGHRCWLTHRAGISLYDGVHQGATGASDLADIKNSPAVRELSEADWDAYFRDQAYQSIREDPGRILSLAVGKMQRMWSPILHADEVRAPMVRIIVAVWTLLLYGFSLLGIWTLRRRWAITVFLLTPAICLSAVHSIFIGSVRYRLGALPMLAVLAAFGLASLWRRRGDPEAAARPPYA